jgi:hypothetical protein
MPVLRFLVVAVVAFVAGSTVTPLLWQPLLQQSQEILSPFALLSAAIFVAAVGYVIGQWKR